jgi:hypothetical protein
MMPSPFMGSYLGLDSFPGMPHHGAALTDPPNAYTTSGGKGCIHNRDNAKLVGLEEASPACEDKSE